MNSLRTKLLTGLAIPASPLALTASRQIDERRQRALWRYYTAAGAGGIAVGVHTTQFAIREPRFNLFRPLIELAKDEFDRAAAPLVRIGGICGRTPQAAAEARLLADNAFHAGLLSLGALRDANDDALVAHCRAIADIIPIVGFYLQPAAGGRILPYSFWRRFFEIPNVVAVKIAPFNRYQTIDVIRAAVESGRTDIALYTGNDDNILLDLLTPHRFQHAGQLAERRIVGGLLGHWAVWTRRAVELLAMAHNPTAPLPDLLALNLTITDMNAALFDVAHNFAGCIAGIHEILHRQGLLEDLVFLDDREALSPGQSAELDRVCRAYPHLTDDDFVRQNLAAWLR